MLIHTLPHAVTRLQYALMNVLPLLRSKLYGASIFRSGGGKRLALLRPPFFNVATFCDALPPCYRLPCCFAVSASTSPDPPLPFPSPPRSPMYVGPGLLLSTSLPHMLPSSEPVPP